MVHDLQASSDLCWNSHVDGIVSKARKRVFLIYQLKRAGIGQCDLVRIYISVIRPVVEYACPAWHTNLPKYVSDTINSNTKPVALESYHTLPGRMCRSAPQCSTVASLASRSLSVASSRHALPTRKSPRWMCLWCHCL